MSTLSKKLLMTLAVSVLLVACKSTPMKPATVEDKSPAPPTATNATPSDNTGADTGAIKEAQIDSNANGDDKNNPLKDPNNILSKRSIYFDYDSDAVRA
jgi:peptidoglycan-associated lipoprotein